MPKAFKVLNYYHIFNSVTLVHVLSDIDECSEAYGNCEQLCANTDGGFECSCMLGYRLDQTNKSLCTG